MAFTVGTIQPIVPANVGGGHNDLPIWPYNEIDSSTYKIGTPSIVSAGAELTTGSTGLTTGIIGFSLQAGQNIATAPEYPNPGGLYPAGSTPATAQVVTPLLMCLALPNVIFEGTLGNNATDYTVGADGSNLFVHYGLSLDTVSGYWYVDVNLTTTNSAVFVLGIKNVQDVVLGTTKNVRVYFTVLQDATMYTTLT